MQTIKKQAYNNFNPKVKVSIITCCYNRAKTISDAIESILNQDYDNIEYIIIDGASTDGTVSKVNYLKEKFDTWKAKNSNSDFKFISEPDHGMYEAINKGIRMATGDVIGLVHSDDFLYDEHTISAIVKTFKETEADMVYGNGLYVDYTDTDNIIRNWISGSYSKNKVKNGWLPLHPTCYIKKDAMMSGGLYNEKYKIAADTDLLIRYLYKRGLKVAYLNQYIVRMRMGGLSTDTRGFMSVWNEDIEVLRENGLPPVRTKLLKMARKVPQFNLLSILKRKTNYPFIFQKRRKEHIDRAFYEILKYSLHDEKPIPDSARAIDWQDLLQWARKHSIVGVIWRGIERAQDNGLNELNAVKRTDVMDWAGRAHKIKERNMLMDKYSAKCISNFDHEGFDACILKGQGNTLLYPDIYERSCGDIDIWVRPRQELRDKMKGKSDRWITFCYVRYLFPKAKFKCQHIEFPVWEKKKVSVEVHFYPMYLENYFSNRKLKAFYKKHEEEQFANWHNMPDDAGKICCPTPEFNAIYQLTHINVHLLIEGIGLRQFIDYFYVLRALPTEKHAEIEKLLKEMRLLKLAQAVTWIEKEVLGLEERYFFTKPDEERGRHLLSEIERGGNFGKSDTSKPESDGEEGNMAVQIWKLKRNAGFMFDYPSEELSEPIFRLTHWLWRQWYQLKWRMR